MAILDLPQELLHILHIWFVPSKYYIPFKELVGILIANRGIQQGSEAAPLLWTLCMHLLMIDLLARYSISWLHDYLIAYADDFHLRWTFTTQTDGLLALSELSFVLTLMQSYGLHINV